MKKTLILITIFSLNFFIPNSLEASIKQDVKVIKINPIKANSGHSDQENNLIEEYKPLFKVIPIYPRRAQERGTQGYVDVSFTITSKGSVENIKVLEGMCGNPKYEDSLRPCSMFDSSSERAATKLKYKPRILNDIPTSVENVIHRFIFLMDD